jgi:hypothetical protein
LHKKKNAIPKLANFSEVIQQEGRVIRELREQYRCNQHDTYFVDNERHTKLTAMHLQCWAKEIVIVLLIFYITDQIIRIAGSRPITAR